MRYASNAQKIRTRITAPKPARSVARLLQPRPTPLLSYRLPGNAREYDIYCIHRKAAPSYDQNNYRTASPTWRWRPYLPNKRVVTFPGGERAGRRSALALFLLSNRVAHAGVCPFRLDNDPFRWR